MTVTQPQTRLNDGREMPQLGFGVWQTPADETAKVVKVAIEAGYQSVDTAAIYKNEEGVGEALRETGAPIFVTTKLWNEDHGFDAALRAFDATAKRLGRTDVDLYLIHWPSPSRGLYIDSWRALVRLQSEGRAKSIGVSNFAIPHLNEIVEATGVIPALNQIELHPRFQQRELRAFHRQHGIVTESWSPLGQGKLLDEPVLAQIGAKHGKTPAQVVIRWHLDNDLVAIPKSVTPSRIRDNLDVFDFRLDPEDTVAIEALDTASGRIGPDPMTAPF